MSDRVEIKGGADEFEAAVIAVVLDQIARDEGAAAHGEPNSSRGLPAWILATRLSGEPGLSREENRQAH